MSKSSPSVVARIFYFLNYLLALATIAAYLAWFINPAWFTWAGVLALAVPAFLVLNVGFMVIWLIFYQRFALLSLIVLALGWWHVRSLVGFGPAATPPTGETIRVMSYNVRNFRYTWPGKIPSDHPGMKAITDSLQPDIFCMQEFFAGGDWIPNFRLKHKYVAKKKGLTLAIYTNFPIINQGEVAYGISGGAYRNFIYADVLRGNDTLRVINIHLISIRLDEEDLSTLADVERLDEERLQRSGKNVMKRLVKSGEVRGQQVDAVANFIALSPYPVILCGDLNDTPTTYSYRKLTKNLDDTFVQAGNGFGTTHPKFEKRNLPLRIDHVLVSPAITATSWRYIKSDLSDHFPVVTDVVMGSR